jgi:hypothetical protein
MENGPNGMWFPGDQSGPGLGMCQRRAEHRRWMRFRPSYNQLWALVVSLAGSLAPLHHAQAQEPTVPPPVANAYLMPSRPHHWWNCLSANDGIPRTFSYYYTPWLNQPIHFRVVGPDGKTYWRSTVRGLPMGSQWLAP